MNVLVLVGAASTLNAGCAASGTTRAKPSATPLPNIVPFPTGSATLGDVKLSPSPGTDASLVENLKRDLRVKTIRMAYAMEKTSATCNKKHLQAEPGATVKCAVAYEGVHVPWNVLIKGQSITPGLVEYTAEPAQGVITRAGAVRFYWENKAFGHQVRCSAMPDVELVPLRRPTRYQCETAPLARTPSRQRKPARGFYQFG